MELPTEFKGTIYFYQNIKYGFMQVFDYELNEPEHILLGSHDVDVSFDLKHDDAVNQIVSKLKDEKKRIQAEAQIQLNQVDEKINSLLAIGYD
jgi:L-arabinose isomerase